jgi:hypothetical protein
MTRQTKQGMMWRLETAGAHVYDCFNTSPKNVILPGYFNVAKPAEDT